MKLRKHPHLIENNAVLFLRRLSEKYGKKLTLASIPQSEWEEIAAQGFDLVWLMGVWKRSPGAREKALLDPNLCTEYLHALEDWKDEDVQGSPYAVYDYTLDPALGPAKSLQDLKRNLHKAGLKLIVDYVPNHLALDHPRTLSSPGCFVEVPEDIFQKNPGLFFETKGRHFLAHGKDPHFPPWDDTVQINYFSPQAREAAVHELLQIAQVSNGVRCDMAMLGLSRVFEHTWGPFLKNTPKPETEFWTEIIGKVRARYPEFIFLAEVYWDLEWEMQNLGFDFTYDKKLYDRLLHASPLEIQEHLKAELSYQEHSARFIENHDEPRAMESFGAEKSRAAAVIMSTVPGMRFFQEGQTQGKKNRIPVQLAREPQEKENPETVHFYELLLKYARHNALHEGQWQIGETVSAGGSHSNHTSLLSWGWRLGKDYRFIVVNYSSQPAQGRVFFQSEQLPSGVIRMKDVLTGAIYERDAGEIKKQGLYADLAAWKSHLFEIETK